MGLIRLILAFAIVSNHYQNHQLFDFLYASVAVKSFYIISGFYMALILNNNSYVNKRIFIFQDLCDFIQFTLYV